MFRFQLIISMILFYGFNVNAQNKLLKVKSYYPKDSILFNQQIVGVKYNYENNLYGKTTMIIHSESSNGNYEFILKKKINKISKYGGDSVNVYGANGIIVRKDYNEPFTISEHTIYAFVILHQQERNSIQVTFQDFGNEVYTPNFVYDLCSVSDENNDGVPEFYLSYIGESDGLDAKPFKQIVYTYLSTSTNKNFIKSKSTAFYPAGNLEDVYHVKYDDNWNQLPKSIQLKSAGIIKKHKNSPNYEK